VVHESARAELCAVVDTEPARAAESAALYQAEALTDFRQLVGKVDAAVVAVPTTSHEAVAIPLLEAGIDVLVEKPIAPDMESAGRMAAAAERHGRILQVGHLERFNPAVVELERRATLPLFFEIHRLNLFSPRSLDVDVVLDLMIHDIDIVLALAKAEPSEIRAAGIRILSHKVERAHAISQRLRGQPDGQPRLHRAGP
jgi:predicted dehydrogenase